MASVKSSPRRFERPPAAQLGLEQCAGWAGPSARRGPPLAPAPPGAAPFATAPRGGRAAGRGVVVVLVAAIGREADRHVQAVGRPRPPRSPAAAVRATGATAPPPPQNETRSRRWRPRSAMCAKPINWLRVAASLARTLQAAPPRSVAPGRLAGRALVRLGGQPVGAAHQSNAACEQDDSPIRVAPGGRGRRYARGRRVVAIGSPGAAVSTASAGRAALGAAHLGF